MKLGSRFLAVLVLATLFASLPLLAKDSGLPMMQIKVGNKTLQVEIADNDQARQKGLMFRTQLKVDHGMLFVFPRPRALSFWTKNTFIPLSIGFFDKNFRLINVEKMQPLKSVMDQNINHYLSKGPAILALEVNKGWFETNKIKPGARITFVGPVKSELLLDLKQKASRQ